MDAFPSDCWLNCNKCVIMQLFSVSVSANDNSKLKVIHAGALVLEKRLSEESDINYRIVQDGLALMLDHVTKRCLHVSRG